jgi:hypothetical protein
MAERAVAGSLELRPAKAGVSTWALSVSVRKWHHARSATVPFCAMYLLSKAC